MYRLSQGLHKSLLNGSYKQQLTNKSSRTYPSNADTHTHLAWHTCSESHRFLGHRALWRRFHTQTHTHTHMKIKFRCSFANNLLHCLRNMTNFFRVFSISGSKMGRVVGASLETSIKCVVSVALWWWHFHTEDDAPSPASRGVSGKWSAKFYDWDVTRRDTPTATQPIGDRTLMAVI